MHDVVTIPDNIPTEILSDPAPFPLRVDIDNCIAMQGAMDHHMTVNHGKDLQLSPHPMPEHSLRHPHLRRAQNAAGTIDRPEH